LAHWYFSRLYAVASSLALERWLADVHPLILE